MSLQLTAVSSTQHAHHNTIAALQQPQDLPSPQLQISHPIATHITLTLAQWPLSCACSSFAITEIRQCTDVRHLWVQGVPLWPAAPPVPGGRTAPRHAPPTGLPATGLAPACSFWPPPRAHAHAPTGGPAATLHAGPRQPPASRWGLKPIHGLPHDVWCLQWHLPPFTSISPTDRVHAETQT